MQPFTPQNIKTTAFKTEQNNWTLTSEITYTPLHYDPCRILCSSPVCHHVGPDPSRTPHDLWRCVASGTSLMGHTNLSRTGSWRCSDPVVHMSWCGPRGLNPYSFTSIFLLASHQLSLTVSHQRAGAAVPRQSVLLTSPVSGHNVMADQPKRHGINKFVFLMPSFLASQFKKIFPICYLWHL